MKEINHKSIIAILVIYTLIIGGYGISQFITKTTPESNQEYYEDEMNTANAYITVGDHKKAAEHYKKAAIANNNNQETLFQLANSQYNAKQYEDAEKTFEQVENWGQTRTDYWLIRTENISNLLTTINNIEKAKKYSQKVDNFITDKEGAWLYLTTKAKIYLAEYKYYRIKRNNYAPATKEENQAKETFLATLKDLENVSINRNDTHIMEYRNDLWNQYITFPNSKYQSKFENSLELEKIPYTAEDIERIKRYRPQDDFLEK